jgi:hypothetical protein
MPITLNTPVAQQFPSGTITGFKEQTLIYDSGTGMMTVTYSFQGSGGIETGNQVCTPIPAATFEAFAAVTTRGKMITTIIQYLGLANGTYTTS